MNKWKTFFIIVLFLINIKLVGQAEEVTENVNMTIPSSLSIVFNEDGTNTASTFTIQNNHILPIHIESVEVIGQNGWNLVEEGTQIDADRKEMVLELENQVLLNGENAVNLTITEESEKELGISIVRGAWSEDQKTEQAFQLNVGYSIGTKEFTITFDKNGGTLSTKTKTAENGTIVSLPTPTKSGYIFLGWEDEDGNLYKETLVMPVGDIELIAQWEKAPEVFAVYCEDDWSLRFYNRTDMPEDGDVYDGKTVTKVYSDFIEDTFTSQYSIPWRSYRRSISTVEVMDEIKPVSTARWFYDMRKCENIYMEKLDTSEVQDMSYMFYYAGATITNFVVHGLEEMDTSSATDMSYMFHSSLCVPATLTLDLTGWDVSNVTNMSYMFSRIGGVGKYQYIDLSNWDTSKLKDTSYMFYRESTDASRTDYYLNLTNWNTSSFENMLGMFENYGVNTATVKVDGLTEWDTSSVTNMSRAFYQSGKYSTSWDIGDLSKWNTSSVVDMSEMFYMTGERYIDYTFDLREWDVSNVTTYDDFNYGVTDKVLAPAFSE